MSLEELCVELIDQWRMSLEDGYEYKFVVKVYKGNPYVASHPLPGRMKVIEEAALVGLSDWTESDLYSIKISNKEIKVNPV